MAGTIDIDAIRKLSVEQRLALVARIMATLAEEGTEPSFSPEADAELERRAVMARANPGEGMSLAEFDQRLEARRRDRA
ncbi:MAG: addiction module protein [Planctomycetes bacterium]|nr:addiction module protein [Planctomycetota bacterium]